MSFKPYCCVLLFCVFNSLLTFAQQDYRDGYILKMQDTIRGKIDYQSDQSLASTCYFKDDQNKKTAFSPNEIEGFRFHDGRYFVSRKVANKHLFLEFLLKGKISLYYLRDEQGDHYYIEKGGADTLIELSYEEEVRFDNDKPYAYESTKHIGVLRYYMQDAPALLNQIDGIGAPAHKPLINLAKQYHKAVCVDGENCIVYENKAKLFGLGLELLGGVARYAAVEGSGERSIGQGGIMANIWLPRANDHFYLRVGLLHSNPDPSLHKSGTEFNIHLGYFGSSKKRIRPMVSISIFSPTYTAGVSVKIYKSLYTGVQLWANYYSSTDFILFPAGLSSYAGMGNMYFEF